MSLEERMMNMKRADGLITRTKTFLLRPGANYYAREIKSCVGR